MVGQTHPVSKASGGGFARQWRMVKRRWGLYLLLSIPVIYVFIFNYIPVYGVTLAFKSYDIRAGIIDSPWIGFYQIQRFTTNVKFWKILSNTLFISLYNLVAGFPIPILLAIGLTHLMSDKYRKTIQMVTYAPHFLSTVIMVGLLNQLLSLHNGLLNRMLELFGANAVNFLGKPEYFRHVYVCRAFPVKPKRTQMSFHLKGDETHVLCDSEQTRSLWKWKNSSDSRAVSGGYR